MVRFSEDFAQKEGYPKMVLHARKVVLGFYLSLGYKAVGEEFEEIGIPHFKMEREMGDRT
jgi:predicted GNAT family N-acyltransferase